MLTVLFLIGWMRSIEKALKKWLKYYHQAVTGLITSVLQHIMSIKSLMINVTGALHP